MGAGSQFEVIHSYIASSRPTWATGTLSHKKDRDRERRQPGAHRLGLCLASEGLPVLTRSSGTWCTVQTSATPPSHWSCTDSGPIASWPSSSSRVTENGNAEWRLAPCATSTQPLWRSLRYRYRASGQLTGVVWPTSPLGQLTGVAWPTSPGRQAHLFSVSESLVAGSSGAGHSCFAGSCSQISG